jgi:hypothetical protein
MLKKYFYTVKEVRGKVSFYLQNDKYASQLSCDASPEAYLSLRVTAESICHLVNEMWQVCLRWSFSKDICEAYLSFCESNDTLPRDSFTVTLKEIQFDKYRSRSRNDVFSGSATLIRTINTQLFITYSSRINVKISQK